VRARSLLARLTRVTAYVFVVTAGLGVLGARQVHAKAKDSAFVVGEQLLKLSETDSVDSEAHELSINGQTIHITSAQTTLPLKTVLDRFQRSCEDHADGMVKDLRDLDSAIGREESKEGHAGVGVLRDDRDGRGVVACFATGEDTDANGLGSRLEKFVRSHDLADLGALRYVAARTLEGGATQVVASWTEDRFKLDEMFPEHGDAKGDDPKIAPRPASSRRILSARDKRAPYGVFLYEKPGSTMKEALDAYAVHAKNVGFTMHDVVTERAPEARAFEKDGVDVLVSAETVEGGSVLSVIEMPAPFAGKKETL
jgi:hypothetical protein